MLVKYPKTMHLPFSPGLQNDDRLIQDLDFLEASGDIIITEKRDGENTTMHHDRVHARSLDSRHHLSRDWVKSLHGQIKRDIPIDMRICGENIYALHSIEYTGLETYFEVFNIWKETTCLSWNDTLEWCELLGLKTVPVLYRGPWDTDIVKGILDGEDMNRVEGYVVRVAKSFELANFDTRIAKYVRKNHVQTDELWMLKPVVPNKLKDTI